MSRSYSSQVTVQAFILKCTLLSQRGERQLRGQDRGQHPGYTQHSGRGPEEGDQLLREEPQRLRQPPSSAGGGR